MADVIRSPRARNDIKRVLQYTIKKWGALCERRLALGGRIGRVKHGRRLRDRVDLSS